MDYLYTLQNYGVHMNKAERKSSWECWKVKADVMVLWLNMINDMRC